MRTVLLGLIAGVMVLTAMPACARICYEKASARPEALTEPADKPESLEEEYVTYYTRADVEMLAKLMWPGGSAVKRSGRAWPGRC